MPLFAIFVGGVRRAVASMGGVESETRGQGSKADKGRVSGTEGHTLKIIMAAVLRLGIGLEKM